MIVEMKHHNNNNNEFILRSSLTLMKQKILVTTIEWGMSSKVLTKDDWLNISLEAIRGFMT